MNKLIGQSGAQASAEKNGHPAGVKPAEPDPAPHRKADLYNEGARLPEQLSRLLFLEGMLAGRRVLEVGATSSAVARFLIEQGASRVVCAVDVSAQPQLLDHLRQANELEHVDFRAIRPAGGSRPPSPGRSVVPVLPGDDGAFDLVIDFGLPQALVRGEISRLQDIKRVLSEDGFALTSLASASTQGLGTLLDPPGRSSGGPVASYRGVVEALKGQFDLVQVYFQSLLLGYLFGSFDVDPKDDGIAPQTALMGHDPEPAGNYLFAFGNAVPLIEDVCLVQVPFDALLQAFLERRGARNFEDRTEVLPPPAARPLPSFADSEPRRGSAATQSDDDDVFDNDGNRASDTQPFAVPRFADEKTTASEFDRLNDAVAEREATILALRTALDAVARESARTLLPDEVAVADLAQALDETSARVIALEASLVIARGELERAGRAKEDLTAELRGDRDELAERLVGLDRERVELTRRVRVLEDERDLLALRSNELEEAVLTAGAERSDLQSELLAVQTLAEGERQRARLEREMLEAALAANAEQMRELEGESQSVLQETRHALQTRVKQAEEETRTAVSRLKASQGDADAELARRLREAEEALPVLRTRVSSLEAALSEAESASAADIASVVDRLQSELQAEIVRLQGEVEAATARARASEARAIAIDEERLTVRSRVDALEGDAVRLAAGVKALVEERAHLSGQLGSVSEGSAQRELELAREKLRADEAVRALDDARASLQNADSAHAELEKLTDKRRSDQRIIEELRARLQDTRAAVDEVTAQRQVVQQALAARDAEVFERRAEQQRLQGELERKTHELNELQKARASVDDAAAALSLEVRRLHTVVDETGLQLQQLTAQKDEAQKLAALNDEKRAVAEAEAVKALEGIEAERGAANAAAAAELQARLQELREAFAEEKAGLLRGAADERDALQESLAQRHTAATRAALEDAVKQGEEMLARQLQLAEAAAAEKADARVDAEREAFATRLKDAQEQLDRVRAAFDDEKAQLRREFSETQTRLESEIEATRDELAQSTESLLALEERAHLMESEQRAQADERQRLLRERGDLELALAAARDEFSAQSARLRDVEATAAVAVRDLTAELASRAADAEAQRLDLTTARTALELRSEDLQARLEVELSAVAALRTRVAEVEARAAGAEAEVVAVTGKLAAAESAWVSADDLLSSSRAALAAVGEAKAKETTALQAQLDDVNVELAESRVLLQERERGLEDARARLQAAADQNAEFEDQVRGARAAFDDLARSKADDAGAQQALLDESAVELTRANELLAERERNLEETRFKLHESEQRVRDFDAERARLELVLREAKDAAAADLAALETVAGEEAKERAIELRALGEERAAAVAAAAAAATALNAANEAKDAATASASANAAAVEAARLELKTAKEERDAAVATATAAVEELTSTTSVFDDLAKENSEAATQLKAAHEMLRNGQRVLDETRAKTTALQTQIDERDTALKALELRSASAVKDLEVRCARLEAQGEIAEATLSEARSLLSVERARGDLFHDELDEATQTLARERARGDLFRADLEEAQLALGRMREQLKDVREHGLEVQETLNNISKSAEGEALRSDAFQAQVDEAQQQLAAERHRSELLQAQLDEAQHAAARAAARAAELSGQLDDAQETFLLRRAAHQGDLDRLVGHRLAEKSATQRIVDELKAAAAAAEAARIATAARLQVAEDAHRGLAEQLAALAAEGGATAELRSLNESLQAELAGLRSALELAREDISTLETQQQDQQSEAVMLAREELMLVAAERDQLKENVALDVEARSKAEDARDAAKAAAKAAEESAAAELRRRQELEAELVRVRAEAKAPGVADDVLALLKEKVEAAEKAAKTKDAKIAEQAERINRLTERIVRSEGLG